MSETETPFAYLVRTGATIEDDNPQVFRTLDAAVQFMSTASQLGEPVVPCGMESCCVPCRIYECFDGARTVELPREAYGRPITPEEAAALVKKRETQPWGIYDTYVSDTNIPFETRVKFLDGLRVWLTAEEIKAKTDR